MPKGSREKSVKAALRSAVEEKHIDSQMGQEQAQQTAVGDLVPECLPDDTEEMDVGYLLTPGKIKECLEVVEKGIVGKTIRWKRCVRPEWAKILGVEDIRDSDFKYLRHHYKNSTKQQRRKAKLDDEAKSNSGAEDVQTDSELELLDPEDEEFGRYIIDKELTRSNYSVIYLAVDERTGHEVIMKRALVFDNYQEQFRQEIKMTKKLQGPGIVRFLETMRDCNEDCEEHCSKHLYMVLEKMDTDIGTALKDRGSPRPEERRRLMHAALVSVKTLHDQDIVHGDIKPENFFASIFAGLKLGDFGNASTPGHPIPGRQNYSVMYRSPEQFDVDIIKARAIDKRRDIWALGIFHQDLIMGKSHWNRPNRENQQWTAVREIHCAKALSTRKEFEHIKGNELKFLKGLCQLQAEDRLTVDQALEHDWFKE